MTPLKKQIAIVFTATKLAVWQISSPPTEYWLWDRYLAGEKKIVAWPIVLQELR